MDPLLVTVAMLVLGLALFAVVAPSHAGPRRREELGTLLTQLDGTDPRER